MRSDGVVVTDITVGVGGLGFDYQSVTVSPTIRRRCDVFLELCCPGASLRRLTPPIVACNTASIMKIWFDFDRRYLITLKRSDNVCPVYS